VENRPAGPKGAREARLNDTKRFGEAENAPDFGNRLSNIRL
jgi:hypothetical protein